MATNSNRQNLHFADNLEGRQSSAGAAAQPPTRLSIKDKLFRLKKIGTDLDDQEDDENQFKVGGDYFYFILLCIQEF